MYTMNHVRLALSGAKNISYYIFIQQLAQCGPDSGFYQEHSNDNEPSNKRKRTKLSHWYGMAAWQIFTRDVLLESLKVRYDILKYFYP